MPPQPPLNGVSPLCWMKLPSSDRRPTDSKAHLETNHYRLVALDGLLTSHRTSKRSAKIDKVYRDMSETQKLLIERANHGTTRSVYRLIVCVQPWD